MIQNQNLTNKPINGDILNNINIESPINEFDTLQHNNLNNSQQHNIFTKTLPPNLKNSHGTMFDNHLLNVSDYNRETGAAFEQYNKEILNILSIHLLNKQLISQKEIIQIIIKVIVALIAEFVVLKIIINFF